jgi:hypothetical protein
LWDNDINHTELLKDLILMQKYQLLEKELINKEEIIINSQNKGGLSTVMGRKLLQNQTIEHELATIHSFGILMQYLDDCLDVYHDSQVGAYTFITSKATIQDALSDFLLFFQQWKDNLNRLKTTSDNKKKYFEIGCVLHNFSYCVLKKIEANYPLYQHYDYAIWKREDVVFDFATKQGKKDYFLRYKDILDL